MKSLFQSLIKLYAALISPLIGRNCRFEPTCSCYAHDALEKHGVLKGLYLTFRRILSCQPWSKKNYVDPVPERFAWSDILGYKRKDQNKIDAKITTPTSKSEP